MQAHGAEMLRIACCLATERGVRVCAPVHDALLIEAPISLIDDAVSTTRGAMAEAAPKALCSAVWIDTDVEIVRYPDRYSDPRGQAMWDRVTSRPASILRVIRLLSARRVLRVHNALKHLSIPTLPPINLN